MQMQTETRSLMFFGLWMLTFLGMPIGGGLARLIIGPADVPLRGLLGGLIAGAVIGLAQWLALRQTREISPLWIAATSAGLGVGFAAALALVGNDLSATSVTVRAAISGIAIAALQWLVLREVVPNAWVWALVVAVAWPVAWTITRVIGVDLTQGWVVFGAAGAIVFALVTAVTLVAIRQ